MARVHANQTAVVIVDGLITSVRKGQDFDEDDQVVREHPVLFEPPVEEATANPGQRRSTR